jgi:hypothetical protein
MLAIQPKVNKCFNSYNPFLHLYMLRTDFGWQLLHSYYILTSLEQSNVKFARQGELHVFYVSLNIQIRSFDNKIIK